MGSDLLTRLDEQAERVVAAKPDDLARELLRYDRLVRHDALGALVIKQLDREAQGRHARHVEHDALLVNELRDLKAELVRRLPQLEDWRWAPYPGGPTGIVTGFEKQASEQRPGCARALLDRLERGMRALLYGERAMGGRSGGEGRDYLGLIGDLALWRNEIAERERRELADYRQSGAVAAMLALVRLAATSAKDPGATFDRAAAVKRFGSVWAETVGSPEQIERRRRDAEQARRRDVAVFHGEVRRRVVLAQVEMGRRPNAGRWIYRAALAPAILGTVVIAAGVDSQGVLARVVGSVLIATAALAFAAGVVAERRRQSSAARAGGYD